MIRTKSKAKAKDVAAGNERAPTLAEQLKGYAGDEWWYERYRIVKAMRDEDCTLHEISQRLAINRERVRVILEMQGRKPVGRPSSGKVVVSIRLDPAVIAKFKATGDGWQARINDVLMAVKL